MSRITKRRRPLLNHCRRGAAVVELALVSPFLVVVALGTCEVGRALHKEAALSTAARNACATATRAATSHADILYDVKRSLAAAGLPADEASVDVFINDQPGDISKAKRYDKISVQVRLQSKEANSSNMFFPQQAAQAESMAMMKQG